jgi:hypothetical protein
MVVRWLGDYGIPTQKQKEGFSGVSEMKGKFRLPNQQAKTYNRRDSQMVTHSSTSRPVQCLCMAERTGCPVFTDLWLYVLLVLAVEALKVVKHCTLNRCEKTIENR